MAFWDELREKITQGSQEALQKTREIADVVTMNADISDSKRKIRELHEELGELLVKEAFSEENADTAPREIVLKDWKEIYSKVRFIRSEEEVIALNESKISELKSEVKCPQCGSRIMKGMSFCPECGAKLMKPAAQESGPAASDEGKAEEPLQGQPAPETGTAQDQTPET